MTQYSAIAADLRRRILDGEFAVGSSLPSEARLCVHYAVSRATVRNALSTLQARYLISARRGRGWYVNATEHTQGFDHMSSFAQWATEHHLSAGGRFVSRDHDRASITELRALHSPADQTVARTLRLRSLDQRWVMLERSTWAPWVASIVDSMPDDIPSTTAGLAESGVDVVFTRHRIEAVAASSEDAQLLGVRRSSPLLMVRRLTTARDGRVVELGEDRYVPGSIVFEVTASGGIARRGAD